MNEILATSKVYGNYQTSIPKEIRKKNNIDKETVLEWSIDKEGNTIVNFRKRRDIRKIERVESDRSRSSSNNSRQFLRSKTVLSKRPIVMQ